ncbi:hypothetical protein EJ06DRAFT_58579 [Trichodelitschia bisporula]|uniref:Uncharacterized protein n=1 Tax=Trichodelitschia bisporula TaxID=703511 RepID=A0A6G1HU83_9PEZI|nr:hypothetical protein EJ06DRAFT_58579 [Trichodelitschia bisporula]
MRLPTLDVVARAVHQGFRRTVQHPPDLPRHGLGVPLARNRSNSIAPNLQAVRQLCRMSTPMPCRLNHNRPPTKGNSSRSVYKLVDVRASEARPGEFSGSVGPNWLPQSHLSRPLVTAAQGSIPHGAFAVANYPPDSINSRPGMPCIMALTPASRRTLSRASHDCEISRHIVATVACYFYGSVYAICWDHYFPTAGLLLPRAPSIIPRTRTSIVLQT